MTDPDEDETVEAPTSALDPGLYEEVFEGSQQPDGVHFRADGD